MSTKPSGVLIAGTVMLVGLSSLSMTGEAAENIDVTATVAGACTLTAPGINFGTYVAGQSNSKDEETTISYDCAPGLDVTLTLSAGSSGNENARAMSSPTAFDAIAYQLYQGFWAQYGVGHRRKRCKREPDACRVTGSHDLWPDPGQPESYTRKRLR